MHRTVGAEPNPGLTVAAWARDAFALLTRVPGVRRAGLALTEGGGRRFRFTASDRGSDAGVDWCHVDAYDDVPLNTAIRAGKPVLGALDDLDGRYSAFVERQRGTATVAVAAIPMVTAGQTLGGYVLFFDRPQSFGHGQLLDLARVGRDLGAALRRAQRGEARPLVALSDEPAPPGAVATVHDVPPHLAAVAKARRFLWRTLQDWGIEDRRAETAVLCLSELVTNAVVHTHAGCVVRALLDQGTLTVMVRDSGTPDAASAEQFDDPLRVHGRGLELVDALVTRWGSELDAAGTTVWFVIEP